MQIYPLGTSGYSVVDLTGSVLMFYVEYNDNNVICGNQSLFMLQEMLVVLYFFEDNGLLYNYNTFWKHGRSVQYYDLSTRFWQFHVIGYTNTSKVFFQGHLTSGEKDKASDFVDKLTFKGFYYERGFCICIYVGVYMYV